MLNIAQQENNYMAKVLLNQAIKYLNGEYLKNHKNKKEILDKLLDAKGLI